MKKHLVVAIALAAGLLSAGAASAAVAGPCCADHACRDEQVVRKFDQEVGGLTGALRAKEVELRQEYGYDGFDAGKVQALEGQIKALKGEIRSVAGKYDLPACCLG